MSHKATNWAVSQRGISPVAKVLLWQLADRHNPDNGCFPDQDTLARDCEISRATVNRNLLDLERVGLVKRVVRHHPVTKKRMPTRYFLAFEDEFATIVSERDDDGDDNADPGESHVSNCDMAPEESHVSPVSGAMSHQSAEPCLTGETHNNGRTSNLTGKGTGKRAEARSRESLFEDCWKAFPMRPGSSRDVAWQMFEKLDDADAKAALKGAERFRAWWLEQEPAKPLEERLRFVKYLSRWLHERGWVEALKLPVKAVASPETAAILAENQTVNRWRQAALFAACEAVRGKKVPETKSGSWMFPNDVVAEAERMLAAQTAKGRPP